MRSPLRSLITSALTTCTSGGGSNKRSFSSLVSLQEISIPAADGTVLAAQRWTKRQTPTSADDEEKVDKPLTSSFDRTILCTHGWLDNCGSHHYLAPRLALELDDATEIVAMDFPGHGHSSHRSKDAPPLVSADLVYYLCEAIQALQSTSFSSSQATLMGDSKDFPDKWAIEQSYSSDEGKSETLPGNKKKIILLGHSLGAGVVALTAASFPELIDQVVLLDAATFLPRKAMDTAEHVRHHILRRQQHSYQEQSRVYPNIERAIQVRQFSATKMPGNQALSYEAARAMVMRGTRKVYIQPVEEEKKDGSESLDINIGDSDDAVQFRHDPRFTWPSIQYMTWEQNEGILAALHKTDVDVCLIHAETGWPVDDYTMKRVEEILQPKFFRKLPGHHHFHADPETASAVGDAVIDFLKR